MSETKQIIEEGLRLLEQASANLDQMIDERFEVADNFKKECAEIKWTKCADVEWL